MTNTVVVCNQLQLALANHLGIAIRHLDGFYRFKDDGEIITISSLPHNFTAAEEETFGVDKEEVYVLCPGSRAVGIIRQTIQECVLKFGCRFNANYGEGVVTIKTF